MACWGDMVKLARPGAETVIVPDEVVTRLLHLLAESWRPALLLEVLRPMARDGRFIPPESMDPDPDWGGRTIITCWLPAFLQARRIRRRSPGDPERTPLPSEMKT